MFDQSFNHFTFPNEDVQFGLLGVAVLLVVKTKESRAFSFISWLGPNDTWLLHNKQ